MKKILKKNQGITLVALVITIVVLLILAAVAIVALSGENNIITKAQNARDSYNEASVNEEIKLKEYWNELEKETKTPSNEDTIIGTWVHFENGEEEDKIQFFEGGTVKRTEKDGSATGLWEETGNNKYNCTMEDEDQFVLVLENGVVHFEGDDDGEWLFIRQ